MIKYLSLFFLGSLFGFVFETLFRRFFSSHKWVNPGFLNGPYIPLYGFGLIILYLISNIEIISPYRDLLLISAMSILLILIELITGLIFLKMNVRLWDYSNRWMNFKGLICPLFSLLWIVITILYYYFINPLIVSFLYYSSNDILIFVLGNIQMVFIFDMVYTYDILHRVRKYAKEKGFIFIYDNLKFHRGKRKVFLKRGRINEVLDDYYQKICK